LEREKNMSEKREHVTRLTTAPPITWLWTLPRRTKGYTHPGLKRKLTPLEESDQTEPTENARRTKNWTQNNNRAVWATC
jgi:hypothetical protein